jgi:hypothetical protein
MRKKISDALGGICEPPVEAVEPVANAAPDSFVVLTYGARTGKAVMLEVGTVFTQAEYEFNDVHLADLLEHNVIERVAVNVTKPASQELVTKDANVSGGNSSGC